MMLREGLPLDRDTYLHCNYGPRKEWPDPFTAEHEDEIPEPLRRAK